MEFWGTIGPACADAELLKKMRQCGMTGLRMNLSHGTLKEHEDWLRLIREAGIRELLIDLQGPELRIGRLDEPLTLTAGDRLQLSPAAAARTRISCPPALFAALAPGQELLLDDGKILIRVLTMQEGFAECTVLRGGLLSGRKSIAAPGLTVNQPTLTAEDHENLRLARACGVTAVMLPFVRGKYDIRNLKQALTDCGAEGIRIYAKIENVDGVRNLPEFVHDADCIVIARGDLGNAMPLWELPGCQKRIAAFCKKEQVPFMVVTQMLDSMTNRAVPTRAEVCDIYNAVADGADSVMLTGETAAGHYPAEAMDYLVRTANCAIKDLQKGIC